MSVKLSTALRNHLLVSGSIKSAFDPGSEIRVYGGTVPATADAAIGGATLLLTIKNGSSGITFAASAAGGVLLKNASETWSGTAVASGVPTFYRHVLTADDGSASTSALRYQGTCGAAGADMNFTAGALTDGGAETLSYHAFEFPAE